MLLSRAEPAELRRHVDRYVDNWALGVILIYNILYDRKYEIIPHMAANEEI
jgi:hypothetical protein